MAEPKQVYYSNLTKLNLTKPNQTNQIERRIVCDEWNIL